MRSWLLAGLIAMGGTGCITQRSLALGQMASPVGKGGADLVVSTGGMYQSQTSPPSSSTDVAGMPLTNQTVSKGFSLPWFEVNADYGIADRVGLNVHLSPAGIQPGAKITLNKSRVANIALLPAIGVGYVSYGQVTNTAGANGIQMENSPTSTTSFLFLVGMKVLISHRSGFYGGVGYDLYLTRTGTSSTIGTGQTSAPTSSTLTSVQHQISAAVGMSIPVGMLSIRPEIAFAIIPALSTSQSSGMGPSVDSSGGFSWAILPGFGFALTTPPTRVDKGAEEDEKNVGPEGDEQREDKAEEQPEEKSSGDDDERPKKKPQKKQEHDYE